MFDACEQVVPPRAAAVHTTLDGFSCCEHSLNLINVIFWNVIHISLIRVLPPSPFTRAFSLTTTPLERRNSYQFNKRAVPHPRLLVLSPYPPPPQRKRNSYQFNKGTIFLPFYPCFLPTHHPPGKNIIPTSFNDKGTIPLPTLFVLSRFLFTLPKTPW